MSILIISLQNDNRLKELAGKITALRGVTEEIHSHAHDFSLIDSTTDTMSNMMTSVRNTGSRLARSANAGHPIFKMVGLALLIVFILYTLTKLF